MTVDDLIRELSELSPLDRTLDVIGVEFVEVRNGRGRSVRLFEGRSDVAYHRGWEDGYEEGYEDGIEDG